ncbi:PfkB family carbohydrate kinase [Mycobacterium sp. PSTR-4-N]|uniref:PfkB family carbohydrate kinase n=1 Tax=Mycobacterium sp. PSTR-4-N TaxID=2917745 RepID=UPI001F14D153|nr:PfkB family carbohydrate kinase [Mycobacterium sp. PSTR-4-N]MCG7594072.1 PfkB family carbohydrate kinase [Mycobacterium sp. PSTR-4-N]
MRNAPDSEPRGIFVGLATLDVIHRIAEPPAVNQKITAAAQFVAAGGPAANAAVTFAALGGDAVLVTALGTDPVADLVRSDLVAHGVEVIDAAAGMPRPVPVSSVSVLDATGDRSVVSLDAVASDIAAPAALHTLVAGADVVLVDGHHPVIGLAAARSAAAQQVRCVVDAGRWKPVMAELLNQRPDMVCSADFRAPGTDDSASTAAALLRDGVPTVVITDGGAPIRWWANGESGSVAVPTVPVRDTLGAGDVFHGAYCYFGAAGVARLTERIEAAARVAALRCSVIGPRAWLAELSHERRR